MAEASGPSPECWWFESTSGYFLQCVHLEELLFKAKISQLAEETDRGPVNVLVRIQF